jgi:hypothetical protein
MVSLQISHFGVFIPLSGTPPQPGSRTERVRYRAHHQVSLGLMNIVVVSLLTGMEQKNVDNRRHDIESKSTLIREMDTGSSIGLSRV